MTKFDDDFRNDVRQIEPRDVATLHNLEVKSQQFPFSLTEIEETLQLNDCHGTLLLNCFKPSGFALYYVEDSGRTLNLIRLTMNDVGLAEGGLEKLVSVLRFTAGDLPEPRLVVTVSENDTDSDLFRRLIDIGFEAVGLIPEMFHEYGNPTDGIKLELPWTTK